MAAKDCGKLEERAPADPFTVELVKSALQAITDEMFVVLQRTSKSPIIYEVLDYAVGLTDPQGQLIAQGEGVTGFLGTFPVAVRQIIEKFTLKGDLHPGDVLANNDPYTGGGTHPSDVTLVMPIFHDSEILAYVANKAHWTDIGGKAPGSWTADATEVYQEGLQFPCIKLFEQGEMNSSLMDLIAANVRFPDMTLGDLWAQVAALRVGERRLLDLCGKHGQEILLACMERLLTEGERRVRLALRELPKGTFTAEDHIDHDGLGHGPFPIRVKVTITDEEFICDFTGSHSQVPGPVNCSSTGLLSEARSILKAVTTPSEPANDGFFRPLKVICPPGTIFSAQRPAPVSTYWEAMGHAADLIWKALAPHVPDKLTAGHFLSVCGTILTGRHPDTDETFLLVEPQAGGWGAGATKDGENGLVCAGDGETYLLPAEVAETRYGVLVERTALAIEGGGAGKFRGGRGLVREYRILAQEAALTATFGRSRHSPWGMAGGRDGSRNYVHVIHADGHEVTFGHVSDYRLQRDDRVRLVTASGGGYGDPRARSPAMILQDLRDGYITLKEARKEYGFEGES
jgi:N-methylhydantoinase B